jgi:hypothetical protein
MKKGGHSQRWAAEPEMMMMMMIMIIIIIIIIIISKAIRSSVISMINEVEGV